MFFNQNGFPGQQPMNPMMAMMGQMPGFNNAYANVMQLMQQTNQTPEQLVRGMLRNGQITQDQFNRASMMANMLTGRKF